MIDLIVFHRLHFHMSREAAWRVFARMKREFVDWNEVRVSSVQELLRVLPEADDPLVLVSFIKDLLALFHSTHHTLNGDLLDGMSPSEVRRYLGQVQGIERSTVDLVLRMKLSHPVVPLEENGWRAMIRLGLVSSSAPRNRIQRLLNDLVRDDEVFSFHRFFIEHGRSVCIEDEGELECSRCRLRSACAHYARARRRAERNGRRSHRGRRSRLK
ncbi:MAG: hypothetical protein JXP34_00725 [Planctomycetes bacterium]|nr:hypothetical protein [Planctomycetota bacterium]